MKQRYVFKQFIAIKDNLEVIARVFISNSRCGEESKTAERQRVRESVGDSVLRREKDSVSNKVDHWRKRCGANLGLISKMIENVASDVVPMIRNFSLLIYKRPLDLTTSRKPLIVSTKFHYKHCLQIITTGDVLSVNLCL